jgi:hypothetical protein
MAGLGTSQRKKRLLQGLRARLAAAMGLGTTVMMVTTKALIGMDDACVNEAGQLKKIPFEIRNPWTIERRAKRANITIQKEVATIRLHGGLLKHTGEKLFFHDGASMFRAS